MTISLSVIHYCLIQPCSGCKDPRYSKSLEKVTLAISGFIMLFNAIDGVGKLTPSELGAVYR